MKLRLDNRNEEGSARQGLWQDQRGSSAVELALVAPVLVYVMLAAADLGLSFMKRAQVYNSARAGAEYASLKGWNSSNISTAAQSATNLAVTVTPTTYCGCATASTVVQQACATSCAGGGTLGTFVSVTTNATYTPISPVHWGQSQTNLSATAVVRIN